MSIKLYLPFTIFILLCCSEGSLGQRLQVSETNTSNVFVELLRGRDGLVGRDGATGPSGPHGERGPQGKEGPPGAQSGGVTYIRWGNSSCPGVTGTKLIYPGIAGGSFHTQLGGGSNYLCLPKDPEYSTTLRYDTRVNRHSFIQGAEYQHTPVGTHDHNVPCAVCLVSARTTMVMIPAKAGCPLSWTREYYGYLMSEWHGGKRTMFVCVDRGMETLPGGHGNTDGALFHTVEASCSTGLPCPPYNHHQEINCVVCTK